MVFRRSNVGLVLNLGTSMVYALVGRGVARGWSDDFIMNN